MPFRDVQAQHERLVILRLLERDKRYTLNLSMLQDYMGALEMHCSRDCIRTHLSWLAEQGLVTVKKVIGVEIATLTTRGVDVAVGRAIVPGVKRPAPTDEI